MSWAALLLGSVLGWSQSADPPRQALVLDKRYSAHDRMVLSRVTGMAIGRSRNVYVADRLDGVALFDSTGALARLMGRKGEGPGEFTAVERIGFFRDTLWVVDPSQRRLLLFDELGRELATIAGQSDGSRRWPAFPRPTLPQAMLHGALIGLQGLPDRPEVERLLLLRAQTEGALELTRLDRARQRLIIHHDRGITFGGSQPFDDSPIWEVSPDGSRVAVIKREAATNRQLDSMTIRFHAADGRVLFTTVCEYLPQAIPARAKAEIANEAARQLARRRVSLRDAEAAVRRSLYLPSYYPPVEEVTIGTTINAWLKLRGYGGRSEAAWMVVDSAGSLIAEVIGPARLRIWAASEDRVWGVEEDEAGGMQLVRYRLGPADGEGSEPRMPGARRMPRCERRDRVM